MTWTYQSPPFGTPAVYRFRGPSVDPGPRVSYRPKVQAPPPQRLVVPPLSRRPLTVEEIWATPPPIAQPRISLFQQIDQAIHLDRLALLLIALALLNGLRAAYPDPMELASLEDLKTADITKMYHIQGHTWYFHDGVWLDP